MSYPSKEDIGVSLDHLTYSCTVLKNREASDLNMTEAEKDLMVRIAKALIDFGREALALPDEPNEELFSFNQIVSTFMVLISLTFKEGMVHQVNHLISVALGAFTIKDTEEQHGTNNSAVH